MCDALRIKLAIKGGRGQRHKMERKVTVVLKETIQGSSLNVLLDELNEVEKVIDHVTCQ